MSNAPFSEWTTMSEDWKSDLTIVMAVLTPLCGWLRRSGREVWFALTWAFSKGCMFDEREGIKSRACWHLGPVWVHIYHQSSISMSAPLDGPVKRWQAGLCCPTHRRAAHPLEAYRKGMEKNLCLIHQLYPTVVSATELSLFSLWKKRENVCRNDPRQL